MSESPSLPPPSEEHMISSGFAQTFKPTKVSRGSDPADPTPHKEMERSSDGR